MEYRGFGGEAVKAVVRAVAGRVVLCRVVSCRGSWKGIICLHVFSKFERRPRAPPVAL